jgi:hypothetical protein
MADIRQPTTGYVHPTDPNLLNIHKAMEYRDQLPHLRVTLGSDNITITGDVNLVDTVSLSSSTLAALETLTVTQGTTPWLTSGTVYASNFTSTVSVSNWPAIQYVNGSLYAIQSGTWSVGVTGNVTVDNFTSTVNINSMPPVSGTVAVSNFTSTVNINSMPPVSGTVAVSNFTSTVYVSNTVTFSNTSISITNFPTTSTVYQGTTPWNITGTVAISSLPEVEIKNDSGNPIPITGNVTATIGNIITVVTTEDAGAKYSFNNHAANATRGWTMDNTMRPVVSFQNGSADAADIIKILEYEIGNNNANQSTIMYEWYEGPLTIAGAAIPSWTTFGVHSQYRVYQDQYSSNQGNTFTVPTGTYMRHSGIIIGKNTSGDEGPVSLYGGNSRNMLTLCMRRVDNATKLDVWFAFTVRELV